MGDWSKWAEKVDKSLAGAPTTPVVVPPPKPFTGEFQTPETVVTVEEGYVTRVEAATDRGRCVKLTSVKPTGLEDYYYPYRASGEPIKPLQEYPLGHMRAEADRFINNLITRCGYVKGFFYADSLGDKSLNPPDKAPEDGDSPTIVTTGDGPAQ